MPDGIGNIAVATDQTNLVDLEFERSKRKANFAQTDAGFFHRYEEIGPEWFNDVLEELKQIAKLDCDWDTYNSNAPDIDTILFAVQLLTRLSGENLGKPRILPTSSESLVFEWLSNSRELSIEVFEPLDYRYYYRDDRSGEEIEREESNVISRLREAVRKFGSTTELEQTA